MPNPAITAPTRLRAVPDAGATPAPAGLSSAAVAWWNALQREFDLGAADARFLLEAALRAHDRMQAAGKLVEQYGIACPDQNGNLRANPAVAAERDARASMLAAFKQLGLDVVPPQPVGRPAGR